MPTDAASRLLTRRQLLEEFHISKESEVKHRRQPDDPLPHLRFGRRLLYPLDEVLEWARRQAEGQK